MASSGSGSAVKRKISDLKVVQLRNELEKRDLDKTGFKAALIERLSKALEEEGLDPETHEFEVPADPTSVKKTRKVAETESDHQTVDEEEEEEEKEGNSEAMDADALQLSIEDEEKLLNEEEESFDKSKVSQQTPVAKPAACKRGRESAAATVVCLCPTPFPPLPSPADEASHQEDANADGGTDAGIPDVKAAKKKGPKAGPKDQDKATPSGEPGAPVKEEGGEEGGDTKKEEEAAEAANDAPASTAPASVTAPAKAAAAKSAGGKAGPKVVGKGNKEHPKKAVVPTSSGRNLWVSGLSSSTRAADLKTLFSKYGKVVTAKIVTNARTPGARCYGFITMGALEEGTKCIQHLHHTELHGKMISVERTKHEPGGALKRSEAKNNQAKARAAGAAVAARKEGKPVAAPTAPKATTAPTKPKTVVKKVAATAAAGTKKKVKPKAPADKATVDNGKEAAAKESGADDGMVVIDENTSKDESKDKQREKRPVRERRSVRSRSRDRPSMRHPSYPVRRPYERSGMGFFRRPSFYQRPFFGRPSMGGSGFRSPSFGPGLHRGSGSHDMMAVRRMRDERMRTRDRIDLREEERRSFHDSMRQRELERKQREEAYRLERERERLRVEREKLEREKLELICLEREKQRQERERIQREREELRQRQLLAGRTEEARRPLKRPLVTDRREDDAFYAERRRSHPSSRRPPDLPRQGTSRASPPSPPRPAPFPGRPEYESNPVPSSKPPSQRSDRDDRFSRHHHGHHHTSGGNHGSSSHGSAHGSSHALSSSPPRAPPSYVQSRSSTEYRHGGPSSRSSALAAPAPAPSSSSSSRRPSSLREDWRTEGSRREHTSSSSASYDAAGSRGFAIPSTWGGTSKTSGSFPGGSGSSGSQQWAPPSSSSSSRKPEGGTSWNGSGDHHHHRWSSTVGGSTSGGSRAVGSSSHSSAGVGASSYSGSLANGSVSSSYNTGDRYSGGGGLRRY